MVLFLIVHGVDNKRFESISLSFHIAYIYIYRKVWKVLKRKEVDIFINTCDIQ